MSQKDRRRRQQADRQRAAAASSARAQRTRRRQQIIVIAIVVLMIVSLFGAYIGATTSQSTPATTTSSTVPAAGLTPQPIAAGGSLDGATPCPPTQGSPERITRFAEPPPLCIDPAFFLRATLTTSLGPMVMLLDPSLAPATVNAFTVLARYGYYDGQPVTSILPRQSFAFGAYFTGDAALTAPGFAVPLDPGGRGQVPTPGSLSMSDAQGRLVVATYERAAAIDPETVLLGVMLSGETTLRAIADLATESGDPFDTVLIESITVETGARIPS